MKIRVSVTDLVDFSCRCGDLHVDPVLSPGAVEGIRAHQSYQRELPDSALIEKSLESVTDLNLGGETVSIRVGGRIDYVLPDTSPATIGEIKSVRIPASRLATSERQRHIAQLKLYGWLWLLLQGVEECDRRDNSVQLECVWINLQDQSRESDRLMVAFSELEAFAVDALKLYADWQIRVRARRERTRLNAQTFAFPFSDFRTGQRDLAAAVYRAFRDRHFLMCEAPTGTGKTASVLFAGLRCMGERHIEQLVYLTAKTSGSQSAADALQRMRANGLEVSGLQISSKVTTCHCLNGTCELDEAGDCPLTKGFYDRLPAARDALLQLEVVDNTALDEIAHEYRLCPFELSLRMIPWVSVVICDYNYVFDPLVRLARFAQPSKRMTLLIDEAHNLVDRSRSMFSAELLRSDCKAMEKEAGSRAALLHNRLQTLSKALSRLASAEKNSGDDRVLEVVPNAVSRAVSDCLSAWESCDDRVLTGSPASFEFWKQMVRFQVINELSDENHRIILSSGSKNDPRGSADVMLKIYCVDASEAISRSLANFRSATVFSATLRPVAYFASALGMPENTQAKTLPSPFRPENLLVSVCTHIDVRYQSRESSIDALVELLHGVVSARIGNYAIFFPSYRYMETVHACFCDRFPDISTIIQQRDSSTENRQEFLQAFANEAPLVAFAIMGGVFGEGVDLPGELLIGAIIIGTGLPSVSLEQRLLEQHFIDNGQNGFDHAARYPGFIRVLQTAGRVIRTEADRGVVVLVDQRFGTGFYRSLYPEHWQVGFMASTVDVLGQIEGFWASA